MGWDSQVSSYAPQVPSEISCILTTGRMEFSYTRFRKNFAKKSTSRISSHDRHLQAFHSAKAERAKTMRPRKRAQSSLTRSVPEFRVDKSLQVLSRKSPTEPKFFKQPADASRRHRLKYHAVAFLSSRAARRLRRIKKTPRRGRVPRRGVGEISGGITSDTGRRGRGSASGSADWLRAGGSGSRSPADPPRR